MKKILILITLIIATLVPCGVNEINGTVQVLDLAESYEQLIHSEADLVNKGNKDRQGSTTYSYKTDYG